MAMKRVLLSLCLFVAASGLLAPAAFAEGHDHHRRVKGHGHHDRGWDASFAGSDDEPAITYPPTSADSGVFFGYPPEPVPGCPKGYRHGPSGKCQPSRMPPMRAVLEEPR
jgi:hypothetical protein